TVRITNKKADKEKPEEARKESETLFEEVNKLINEAETGDSEGTLKEDIQIADQIVRAIYNYKIKAKKGTWEYFVELQLTTMLRIIANSGVRSIEVLNMPY